MRLLLRTLPLLVLVVLARTSPAAPITDPNDPRNWQGATLESFRMLLGYSSLQELVDANLLDDGTFPLTASYAASFAFPDVACGTAPLGIPPASYIGAIAGESGYSNDPNSYALVTSAASEAEYANRANCLDMWWVRDLGNGDILTGHVWDLGAASNQVAVFPIIDEGLLPEESIEFTVYLSNNPNAIQVGTDGEVDWVLAELDKVYLEGWIGGWVADGFSTVWRLPGGQALRYANVVAGGPGAILPDGDDEIDTVFGLTAAGDPVCADGPDVDDDGICDLDDNCPDVSNPLQEDTDENGVGDACQQACGPEDNSAPFFSSPTPTCGSIVDVVPGAQISFSIAAFDSTPGDSIILSVTGLPSTATLTPALPDTGASVTTALAWTPTEQEVGDHILTFTAVDSCGASAACVLTIRVGAVAPPACDGAEPSVLELWPPNHKFVTVEIDGLGDSLSIEIVNITQDEPVRGHASDDTACADARVVNGKLQLRAERLGSGNGRVYEITFLASDPSGGSCEGTVTVCVPHDRSKHKPCVDDGQIYDALGSCDEDGDGQDASELRMSVLPTSQGTVQIEYHMPVASSYAIDIYSVAGRRIAKVDRGHQSAGTYTIEWNSLGIARGVYFVRLRTDGGAVSKHVYVGR